MTHKGRDGCNRWRSKSITFRASPQEYEIIKRMVALSGLTKQEYFLQRLMGVGSEDYWKPSGFQSVKDGAYSAYEGVVSDCRKGKSIGGDSADAGVCSDYFERNAIRTQIDTLAAAVAVLNH